MWDEVSRRTATWSSPEITGNEGVGRRVSRKPAPVVRLSSWGMGMAGAASTLLHVIEAAKSKSDGAVILIVTSKRSVHINPFAKSYRSLALLATIVGRIMCSHSQFRANLQDEMSATGGCGRTSNQWR